MLPHGSLPRVSARLLFCLTTGWLAVACSVDDRGLREGSGGANGLGGTMGITVGSGGAGGSGDGGPWPATGGVAAGGSGVATGGAAGGHAAGGFPAPGHGGVSNNGGGRGGSNPGDGRGGAPEPPPGGAGGTVDPGTGGASNGGAPMTATGGASNGGGGAPAISSGGAVGSGGATSGGNGPNVGGSAGGMAGGAGGAPPCGPATCTNGCCENNVCITARTPTQCGNAGAACAKCAKCFRCGPSNICEFDPASPWKLTCASAVVAMTKSDGSVWDPVAAMSDMKSAPPDPYCQLKLDASTIVMTSAKKDTVMPAWNESITPAMPLTASRLMSQATPWSISLYDDDASGSDLICQLSPTFGVAAFTSGTVTLSGPLCPTVTINLSCALP
jgi:hypothetical protein